VSDTATCSIVGSAAEVEGMTSGETAARTANIDSRNPTRRAMRELPVLGWWDGGPSTHRGFRERGVGFLLSIGAKLLLSLGAMVLCELSVTPGRIC
jgi:hypothetical protein